MKFRVFFFILLVIYSLPAYPSDDKNPDQKGSDNSPVISFSKTEFDFGTIRMGSEAVHYFVFSNSGKSPLIILNVRTSCGCTVTDWPKTPLGAGMKDSLKVEYNTRVKGVFNKTITVQSNARDPLVELRIRGNVVKR